jgi:hypothetical protein
MNDGTLRVAFGTSSTYVARSFTGTPLDTAKKFHVQADIGQTVYFILNQLEEGSPATSPIVVAGAAATRASNGYQLVIPSIPGNFNTTEGVLYCEFTPRFNAGEKVNIHILGVRAAIGDVLTLGGTGLFTSSNGLNYPSNSYSFVKGETVKVCARWNLTLQKYQVIAMGSAGTEADFTQTFQSPAGIKVAQSSTFGAFDIKNILVLDSDKGEAWCKAATSPNIIQAWPFVTDPEILVKWSLNGTITPEKYNSAGGTVQYAHAITGYTTWLDKDNVLRKAYTDEPGFCWSSWVSENLLKYSEDFSNGAWEKGPHMAVSGQLIRAVAGTGYAYIREPNATTGATGAGAYTLKLKTKKGTHRYVGLRAFANEAGEDFAAFDFDTGTWAVANGHTNLLAVNVGDGWWELSATYNAEFSAARYAGFALSTILGQESTTWNGTETIYVAYCHLNRGTTALPYVKTDAYPRNSVSASYSSGSLLSTCKGILIEPSRTNKCANYNTNPVNQAWTVGGGALGGVTLTGDAASTLSVVDDTTMLASAGLQVVCASGKVYKLDNSAGTGSSYATFTGVCGNLNSHNVSLYYRGGNGAIRDSYAGSLLALPGSSGYTRANITFTPTNVNSQFVMQASSGQVVYFILNQLEEGAVVTSPIVCSGASATRASSTGSSSQGLRLPVSGNFSPKQGTLYFEWTTGFSDAECPLNTIQGLVGLRDSFYSLAMFQRDGVGITSVQSVQQTGTAAVKTFTGLTSGVAVKAAIRWGGGTYQAVVNGGTGSLPAYSNDYFLLGTYITLLNAVQSGWIKNVKIYSKDLGVTKCQEITI